MVGENIGLNQANEARTLIKLLEPAERSGDIGLHASSEAVTDGFIAVIESRTFIRECIRRSMQSAFPLHVQTFSEAVELQQSQLPNLILISEIEGNRELRRQRLQVIVSHRAENTRHCAGLQ